MNNSLNHAPDASPLTTGETRVKRAEFRSLHRGSKEMDLVLGQFARKHLAGLSEAELVVYEQLLEEEDALIWEWIVEKTVPPAHYAPLVARLKTHTPDDAWSA